LKAFAEGVALTLKCLLGDPCPDVGPLPAPHSEYACLLISFLLYVTVTSYYLHYIISCTASLNWIALTACGFLQMLSVLFFHMCYFVEYLQTLEYIIYVNLL